MNLLLKPIDWSSFGLVLAILAVLALVFTILILLVSKFCAVQEDPRIGEVTENLSGANCGGCGFAGCADFAKALVEGRADINACSATAKENKQVIATILGATVADTEPMMAIVKCAGDLDSSKTKFDYIGLSTCQAKNAALGGDKVCSKGCLGCGDCAIACTFEGIKVVNGVAVGCPSDCVACGSCVKACPKQIIELIPKRAKVYVACSSECKGKDVMNACKVGCIGCGLCAKNCPQGAIEMVNNLAVINYAKCTGCGICASKCPRKTIKSL
jgi:Na+-translocating ferredoxin:NAD+ oxidoreductase RNF subunit RnfB